MANRDRRNIKFEELVAPGENPRGFTSQTPNGTGKAGNDASGWNKDSPREPWPMVPSTGPWSGNRTGE